MKIHEYQAKDIFRRFDIPVPQGKIAVTPDQAVEISTEFNHQCVVKAQIHAGGRGKGGGIKLAENKDNVIKHANSLLGSNLVTPQTGAEGKRVNILLIEEKLAIEKQLYISIIIDRSTANPVIMASESGGMDIEEVAANTPDLIIKEYINPLIGLQDYQSLYIANRLNIPNESIKTAVSIINKLYKLFIDYDCSLVEINPLIITTDKKIIALDAKVNFDDNAIFRHKDLLNLRDTNEEDPLELEASKYGLNYIRLDGNVGCMVNGAGLAMATMDIIKLSGSSPANFLDVGGGATKEAIENAFKIILMDNQVEAILINIFGGILRCDNLAHGVVNAACSVNVNVPIIIRLEGTNVDEGRKILANSGLKFSIAHNMDDAAKLISKVLDK